jgi:molecular chaperone DnaK
MYKASQAQQQQAPGGESGAGAGGESGAGGEKVVDADFEEVDEEKKRGSR